MKQSYYKKQITKNVVDCINYTLFALATYLLCFFPKASIKVPFVLSLVEFYEQFAIWAWVEIVVFIGFLSLSIISVLKVKVSYQLLNNQKKLNAIGKDIDAIEKDIDAVDEKLKG
ncbi:hypothetical protein MTR11_23785 [Vibrio sp. CCB-PB317]|jgi:hypothetical protein|uniref:hypothetical protein n=1 Tax=Vibrio sp. CCB-PB317 TaxID=2929171 RepID=UPI001FAE13B2|nr:hypothetical protein [Vibrio sp. CCB-PB317]MCJ0884682.1 hypothetical protein [Vibrio sp. CCB-PB317]